MWEDRLLTYVIWTEVLALQNASKLAKAYVEAKYLTKVFSFDEEITEWISHPLFTLAWPFVDYINDAWR